MVALRNSDVVGILFWDGSWNNYYLIVGILHGMYVETWGSVHRKFYRGILVTGCMTWLGSVFTYT